MKKGKSRDGAGALIAINEGLAFGKVKGISGRYAEDVCISVVVSIPALSNGRFN